MSVIRRRHAQPPPVAGPTPGPAPESASEAPGLDPGLASGLAAGLSSESDADTLAAQLVYDWERSRGDSEEPEPEVAHSEPMSGYTAALRVDVVTIFPSYLEPLELSLIGRARTAGLIDILVHDLRDFTADRHRTVDDAPAGGGAGMVMRPEPWGDALASLLVRGRATIGQADAAPLLLVPSPSGAPLTQGLARDLSQLPWLAIACGRYEAIDARVFDDHARWAADMERVYGLAELIIAKQRHGATGKVTLKFDPTITRFSDYAGY